MPCNYKHPANPGMEKGHATEHAAKKECCPRGSLAKRESKRDLKAEKRTTA